MSNTYKIAFLPESFMNHFSKLGEDLFCLTRTNNVDSSSARMFDILRTISYISQYRGLRPTGAKSNIFEDSDIVLPHFLAQKFPSLVTEQTFSTTGCQPSCPAQS